LVFGIAHAFADQVLRFANAAGRIDVNARMAKEPRRKNRDRDERPLGLRQRNGVRRQGHFGDIEFAMPEHPEKCFLDRHVQIVEIDAIGLHRTVTKRARAIVVPTRKAQAQLCHRSSSPLSSLFAKLSMIAISTRRVVATSAMSMPSIPASLTSSASGTSLAF